MAAAEAALAGYGPRFEAAYHGGLTRKIGLGDRREDDAALAGDLLRRMAENQADFTLTFRALCDAAERPDGDGAVRDLFVDPTAYADWAPRWRARLAEEARDPVETAAAMRTVNPAFIPRNHQVEAMIAAAVERADFAPFAALLARPGAALRGPAGPGPVRRGAGGRRGRLQDLLRDLTRPGGPQACGQV